MYFVDNSQTEPNPLFHVLVVDDERTTRMAISEALAATGYEATPASTAEEALRWLARTHFDAVILDMNLPGVYSGLDVLEQAEVVAPHTAFIVLTAYASAESAIMALRVGAHDYLRKPASLEVILTAVREAIHKQRERQRQENAVRLLEQAMTVWQGQAPVLTPVPMAPHADKVYAAGGIVINDSRHQVTLDGELLELTPIEYKLLGKFVREPDTAFSFAELALESHGTAVDEAEARTLLRTHVYRLSRKLAERGADYLHNVRGRGYLLSLGDREGR